MSGKIVKAKDLIKGKEYWIEKSRRAFGVFHHWGKRGNPLFTPIGGSMINSFSRNMEGYISFPKEEEFEEKTFSYETR